jgi:UDPglucose 6-dehydrogenase
MGPPFLQVDILRKDTMPGHDNLPPISILGSGYVGAVTGAGFANLGHNVWLVDIDPRKIEAVRDGRPPVFEPGLADLFSANKMNLFGTTNIQEAVEHTAISFLCVGTPQGVGGSQDLRQVESACKALGSAVARKSRHHTVIVKSTVLPGTTEDVILPIIERESQKTRGDEFGIGVNPEFLQEGSAVRDFQYPDRIVIGRRDEQTRMIMENLFKPFECPKIFVDLKTAEMVKFVNNAFLATKISFANEIGNLCKKMGIDTSDVFQAVGLDRRINPAFFRSGIGFGGSCLPKDLNALIAHAEELGIEHEILNAVRRINETQPEMMLYLLKRHLPDLKHRRIGILGLSFKPGTDDIRESRAIPVIQRLEEEGAKVIAYDPKAMSPFQKLIPAINYAQSANDVLKADAVLIITEWEEFNYIDYSGKIVIDGRRIDRARETARIYEGVCW